MQAASSVCSPYKKKVIEAVENVKKKKRKKGGGATRMVSQMKGLGYEERLRRLMLPTLKYCRVRRGHDRKIQNTGWNL